MQTWVAGGARATCFYQILWTSLWRCLQFYLLSPRTFLVQPPQNEKIWVLVWKRVSDWFAWEKGEYPEKPLFLIQALHQIPCPPPRLQPSPSPEKTFSAGQNTLACQGCSARPTSFPFGFPIRPWAFGLYMFSYLVVMSLLLFECHWRGGDEWFHLHV